MNPHPTPLRASQVSEAISEDEDNKSEVGDDNSDGHQQGMDDAA